MRLYLRFLKYVRPYWHLALAASLALIASGFLGAYPIQLFKRAVDFAVGDAGGDASCTSAVQSSDHARAAL